MILLLAAMLLDLAGASPPVAPSSNELRLEATELAGFLSARLTNASAAPIAIATEDDCQGRTPLSAFIDELDSERAVTTDNRHRECLGEGWRWTVLAPGATTTIRGNNISVDGLGHQSVRLTYRIPTEALATAPRGVRPFSGVSISRWAMRAAPIVVTARIEGDQIVVDHVVSPPASRMSFLVGWKGACPSSVTTLVIRDQPVLDWPAAPAACAGPLAPDWRDLAVGEKWTVRGPIPPSVRGRTVHARYRVTGRDVSLASSIDHRRPAPVFSGRVETVTPVEVPR